MIALSIRQPWAELILNHGKDIENRDWLTKYRGRVLIHASKGCTFDEFEDAVMFADGVLKKSVSIEYEKMKRGGIVGSIEIVDCVTESNSPWFFGKYGFVLRDPKPIKFIPWKGQLGFFNVPDNMLST